MSIPLRWCLLTLLPGAAFGGTWAVNNDYFQNDALLRGATNFEMIFQGDVRASITGGGMSAVTNPFATPTVSSSLNGAGDTVVTFTGSSTIPSGATAKYHLGIFGSGPPPMLLNAGWSFPSAPQDFPARSFFDIFVDIQPSSLTTPQIQLENNSQGTDNVPDAGYMFSPTLIPLEQLNLTNMPPSSFTPLPALDGTYMPGTGAMTSVSDPGSLPYLIVYGSIAGNDQQWMEVTLSDVTTPEPSTVLLVLAGLAVWRRHSCLPRRHSCRRKANLVDSR